MNNDKDKWIWQYTGKDELELGTPVRGVIRDVKAKVIWAPPLKHISAYQNSKIPITGGWIWLINWNSGNSGEASTKLEAIKMVEEKLGIVD